MNVKILSIVATFAFAAALFFTNSNSITSTIEVLSHHQRIEKPLHHHQKIEKPLHKKEKSQKPQKIEIIKEETQAS